MLGSFAVAMAVVLIGAPADQAPAEGKEPSPPYVGKWIAPGRTVAIKTANVQTLEVGAGKLTCLEPRAEGDKSKETGYRVECEFAVSKSGRIFGVITLVGGAINADEGETFSFVPKVKAGMLQLDDFKGPAQMEELIGKANWRIAP